ncbi:MAG: hypothetical protein ACLFXM_15305 [Acidimicrobiia bacterium]
MGDDALDGQVREVLRRSIAERRLRVHDDPVGAIRSRMARRRRRRRTTAGAALAALLLVGTSITVVALRARGPGDEVDVVAQPQADAVIVRSVDGVERFPAPPLDLRRDAAVVWTGDELLVWGGDVEAFNMGLPGDDRSYDDGAAFSPASRTWRRVSRSPLPDNAVTPTGVMTEQGVVLVRGRATALWNPQDDTWRELADAPAEVRDLSTNGSFAMSYSANAVLDVESGSWRPLPEPPERLERPTTTWTGDELVVMGGPGTPFRQAAGIAYHLRNDEWRRLPEPPDEIRAEALSADWDGERVVVVNYDMQAAAYDPETDSWTELPPVPARFYEWVPTVVSAGGKTAALMASAIVVLDESDRWTPLPYGERIVPGAVAAARRAGGSGASTSTVFSWGRDWSNDETVLSAIDLDRAVARQDRVQVGVGSVELPDGFTVVDTGYEEAAIVRTVRVLAEGADQASCTISSTYGGTGDGTGVTETLRNDGRPRDWSHDAAGLVWRTTVLSDLFTVDCDDPGRARRMAESASFPGS